MLGAGACRGPHGVAVLRDFGSGAVACCRAGQRGCGGNTGNGRTVLWLVRSGNASVAAVTGHGCPPAVSTASRRQPRPRSPPTVTTTLGTPRARHSADTASGVVSAHRSGNRSASRSASSVQCRRGRVAERLGARRRGRPGAPACRPRRARRRTVSRPPRAARGPAWPTRSVACGVQVVGPHDLGRVLVALEVAEPGVDLRPERRRPRAVLVGAGAQDHVVLDLARDLQAEPGRHVARHPGRQRVLVRPLGGQDQEHAERPADLDDEDRILAGLLAVLRVAEQVLHSSNAASSG